MIEKSASILSPTTPDIRLRTIEERDIELLRVWKNDNSASFFHQDPIAPEDQTTWFSGYLRRPHDYMFVVEVAGARIGCVGFRILDDCADIYNVMCGVKSACGKGYMKAAIKMVCSYAMKVTSKPLRAKVISTNPAIAWYEHIGFRRVTSRGDHLVVEISREDVDLATVVTVSTG